MNNKKRIKLSISITLLIVLILLFSEGFVITHLHHNCSGKDCPICMEIHLAEAALQQLGFALRTLYLSFVVLVIINIIPVVREISILITPVDCKVRLND